MRPSPTQEQIEILRQQYARYRLEQLRIERELLRRAEARRDHIAFCHFLDQNFRSPPHIRLVADRLRACERYIETRGAEGIGRLIINLPPRTGKSTTISNRWPAYLIGRHPDWRIGLVSYSEGYATDFSRANRDLIRDDEYYHILFPTVTLNPESTSVQRWAISQRSSDNPSVVATGIDGALTGRGFQVIIIDDPTKSRAEAESHAHRKQLHEAYKGTIRTRLEPGGVIVIVCTRWHEEDLPGWLLAMEKRGEGEHFEVLNLPAIAEENDPLGRKPGEPLWPERYPLHELHAIQLALGGPEGYDWVSQYQGHPKPPQGAHVQRNDFKIIDDFPPHISETELVWYRYYDLAASTRTAADYFATARIAFDADENLYIADMLRGRLEWPDQKKIIKLVMLAERESKTRHGIEEALHGTAAIQELSRDNDLRNIPIEGIKVETDKLTRSLPWLSRARIGKVYLVTRAWRHYPPELVDLLERFGVPRAWATPFVEEAVRFTGKGDAHDDQMDVIGGATAMSETSPAQRMLVYLRSKAKEKEAKDA